MKNHVKGFSQWTASLNETRKKWEEDEHGFGSERELNSFEKGKQFFKDAFNIGDSAHKELLRRIKKAVYENPGALHDIQQLGDSLIVAEFEGRRLAVDHDGEYINYGGKTLDVPDLEYETYWLYDKLQMLKDRGDTWRD